MIVVFTLAAQRDVDEIDSWWREQRPDSPDVFADELAEAVKVLGATPGIGRLFTRAPPVRRWMLSTTKHHVYYAFDDDVLVVKRVWSARRRRPRMQ